MNDGQIVEKEGLPNTIKKPKDANPLFWSATKSNGASRLYELEKRAIQRRSELPMRRIPPWIVYDGASLQFFVYGKEPVLDSPIENYRVRTFVLTYFLEDGTLRLIETKEDNSGLDQGTVMRRHLVKKGSHSDAPLMTLSDLKVGSEIALYGRVYHIYDCDQATREFMKKNMNIEQAKGEVVPIDPFHAHKLVVQSRGLIAKSAKAWNVYQRAQKRVQLMEHDGHVLRFWGVWRKTGLLGDERPMVIHFFLSDQSVEIFEPKQPNSGRYPFPAFLKRQKLRKRSMEQSVDAIGAHAEMTSPPKTRGETGTGGSNQFYTDLDFRCGSTINVYGREIELEFVDGFTANHYKSTYGIDQPILPRDIEHDDQVDNDSELLHKQVEGAESVECDGFNIEDAKLLREQLRYLASLISNRPEDADRRFIINYHLDDNTVSIFEKQVRNSGFMGGKFLERSITINTETGKPFEYVDFAAGKDITIFGFKFHLIRADSKTDALLGGKANEVRQSVDLDAECYKLQKLLKSMNAHIRRTFRLFDQNKDGYISLHEFEFLMLCHGWTLSKEQMKVLFDRFDTKHDGRIDFNEFVELVEQV